MLSALETRAHNLGRAQRRLDPPLAGQLMVVAPAGRKRPVAHMVAQRCAGQLGAHATRRPAELARAAPKIKVKRTRPMKINLRLFRACKQLTLWLLALYFGQLALWRVGG